MNPSILNLDTISNCVILNFRLALKSPWIPIFSKFTFVTGIINDLWWNREKKYTIMKIESCSLKDRDWRERPFWFDGRNTIRIGNKGYWDTHGVHECIRRFVIIFTASTPSHEYTIARWIWRDLISVQRRVNNLSLLTIMNFRQFRVHGESSFII